MFGPGSVALKDGVICSVSWLSVRSRNITRAASVARKVNINYQAVSIHYLKDTLLPKWDTSHGLLHKRLMKVAIGTWGQGLSKDTWQVIGQYHQQGPLVHQTAQIRYDDRSHHCFLHELLLWLVVGPNSRP